MVEERRAAKEAAVAGEREFWAEQRERERQMDRVVEEERLRLLKSHAARLVGHLGRIYGVTLPAYRTISRFNPLKLKRFILVLACLTQNRI